MQSWMIALIIIAAVVVLIAVVFISGSLLATHSVLSRRREFSEKKKAKYNYSSERYGIDPTWLDGVKSSMETLSITAYDGIKLGATLIKNPNPTGNVAIVCHGYSATPRSMQVQAKLFYDRGFDVLMPAMRGHDISEGRVGMAWLDRFDVMRWIDLMITRYGDDVKIALFGVSMGGSTVVAVAGMTPPPQVKCVIDDCGFSSQFDEYTACFKGVHFPTPILLLAVGVGVSLMHGYSFRDADITTLAKNMTIPALFIHGEEDKFVPFELGKKLYDACASEDKQFLAVEGAEHALSYVTDPEKYLAACNELLDKCFGPAPERPPEPEQPIEQAGEQATEKATEDAPAEPAPQA